MDFVVKISTDYSEENTLAQFSNPANLVFSRELKGTGRCSFLLPVNDPQIDAIVEHNKIAVYEIRDGSDELVWSGYIDEPEVDFLNALVVGSDEKRGLQHKRIFTNKTWSPETVPNILTTLTSEANSRSGGDRGYLTFDTDLTDSVNKTFEKGASYYDIIEAFASQLGVEWTVELNEIKMFATIGEDKSDASGEPFIEIVSNRNSPNENTIIAFKDKRAGNLLTTSLIGKAGSSYSQQDDNTGVFGHIESFQSFPEGDVAAQTLAHLTEHSGSISTITVEVNTNQIRYDSVQVGDLVKLRVEGYSSKIDVEQSVRILRTSVEIVDRLPSLKITLSDSTRVIRDPANIMAKFDRRLTAIELQ